jgi:putative SOS response-associated peptidase YedK
MAENDSTGNMQPMPAVFPDYAAPVVRNQSGGRELALVRWGMPTPPKYLVGKKTDPGVTNIRSVNSSHCVGGWVLRAVASFHLRASPKMK